MEEETVALLPLMSILDCAYISSIAGEGGKSGWECGWCGLKFFPKHASRALRHVLKIKNHDIAIKAVIPAGCQALHLNLHEGGLNRHEACKHLKEEIDASVGSNQGSVVEALLGRHGVMAVSG